MIFRWSKKTSIAYNLINNFYTFRIYPVKNILFTLHEYINNPLFIVTIQKSLHISHKIASYLNILLCTMIFYIINNFFFNFKIKKRY